MSFITMTNTGVARNSDVARRDIEALDEAKAHMDTYVESGDPDMPGRFVDRGMVGDQARRLEASSGIPFRMSVEKVQKELKRNCSDSDLTIARVCLWTGEADGRPEFLAYPETAQICFAALNRLSPNFKAGEREAFAAYYNPFNKVREFTDRFSGVVYEAASDFYAPGYLGIVRWFGTCDDAFEAVDELRQSVRMFQRSVTDSAIVDDDGQEVPPIESYDHF